MAKGKFYILFTIAFALLGKYPTYEFWSLFYNIFFVVEKLSGDIPKENRIINGKNADIKDYPWQVSLRRPGYTHYCGGSIIDNSRILTAAHCAANRQASNLLVHVGLTCRTDIGYVKIVKKIIIHPHYVAIELTNDIAILILEEQLEFSETIQPIELPSLKLMLTSDAPVITTGWGRNKDGVPPNVLQMAEFNVVAPDVCGIAYQSSEWSKNITPGMICARGVDSVSCYVRKCLFLIYEMLLIVWCFGLIGWQRWTTDLHIAWWKVSVAWNSFFWSGWMLIKLSNSLYTGFILHRLD